MSTDDRLKERAFETDFEAALLAGGWTKGEAKGFSMRRPGRSSASVDGCGGSPPPDVQRHAAQRVASIDEHRVFTGWGQWARGAMGGSGAATGRRQDGLTASKLV